MIPEDKVFRWCFAAIVGALTLVLVSVVFVLLAGLFDPIVDNDKIFEVIGPAFQTIVGTFVGFLGGMTAGRVKS